MSPVSIGVLAVSMSVDAFIAAIGKGAGGQRASLKSAVQTGIVFGVVEAITPLIGWAAGMAASRYVAAVDHWIAFALLGAVGVHMILQALSKDDDQPGTKHTLWATLMTAIGTSIDAMAVGVSLAFLDVNILVIALVIGLTTTLLSSTGIIAGRYLGRRFGRIAEVIGGLALVGLGSVILYEHLTSVPGIG